MQRRRSIAALLAIPLLIAGCSSGVYVGPSPHIAAGAPTATPVPTTSADASPTATPLRTAAPTPAPTATPSNLPTSAAKIYVSDIGQRAILVYASDATGNVAPTLTLDGPVGGTFNPESITIDTSGKLYVADEFEINGTDRFQIDTYAPPLSSSSVPAVLTYSGFNDIMDMATDASGDLYVLDYSNQIFVFSPGATGNAAPIRTIAGSNTGMTRVLGIAVDSSTIYVSEAGDEDGEPAMNEILEYPLGANGNVAPSLLSGSATGLDMPGGLKIDPSGRLVVDNYDFEGNSAVSTIERFAPGAIGDTAPLSSQDVSTFQGSNSEGHICLDGSGDEFLLNYQNPSAIGFFAASATGAVNPTRTITGSMSELSNPQFCAVH